MKHFGRISISILFFFTVFVAVSQKKQIKNLVFEGAGIRGIAYAGVVQVLEKEKLIDSIEKVAGTSAGAIIASMISVGYNSQEINEIIGSTRFNKFRKGVCGVCFLRKRFGWYRSVRFTRFLENLISKKTGNPNLTFKDLRNNPSYKELYVTGTSINRQKTIIFSADNYPNMRIVDAVRISMSIPIYFEAVFIDKDGKVYKKYDKHKDLDIMVDGGILANFPIQIFDTFIEKNNKIQRIPNEYTVGIRIDTDQQIKQDAIKPELVAFNNINDFNGFVEAFYVLVLENLNRNNLTETDWKRTVSVSSKNIGPKIKKLNTQQKNMLINSGIEGMSSYLKNIAR